jgi:hypothetical protein
MPGGAARARSATHPRFCEAFWLKLDSAKLRRRRFFSSISRSSKMSGCKGIRGHRFHACILGWENIGQRNRSAAGRRNPRFAASIERI